jgi:hypothetical protein
LHGERVRQIATERRAFPARHERCFISVEIIRLRRVLKMHNPDTPETIHREHRLTPRPHVPEGEADKVQPEPRPEDRDDVVIIGAEGRMHARKDAPGLSPGG